MKISSSITILFFVLAVSGCSHVAPRYSISANNVESLRAATANGTEKVAIEQFTTFESGLSSIGCRAAGPVQTPDGTTFEKYIQDAISSELKIAQAFSKESSIRLNGRLDYITFNSNIFAGNWQIDMTFSGATVQPFTINTVYPFSTNFAAAVACEQVAAALPAAVQDLIAKLIAHPSFQKIVSQAQ